MPIASFPSPLTTGKWTFCILQRCIFMAPNLNLILKWDGIAVPYARPCMPTPILGLGLSLSIPRLYHIFLRISTPLNGKLSAVAVACFVCRVRVHFVLFRFGLFYIFVWPFDVAICFESVHSYMSPSKCIFVCMFCSCFFPTVCVSRTSAQLERSKSRNTRQMPATWQVRRIRNEQHFSCDLNAYIIYIQGRTGLYSRLCNNFI